jgi:hypothetical protein
MTPRVPKRIVDRNSAIERDNPKNPAAFSRWNAIASRTLAHPAVPPRSRDATPFRRRLDGHEICA